MRHWVARTVALALLVPVAMACSRRGSRTEGSVPVDAPPSVALPAPVRPAPAAPRPAELVAEAELDSAVAARRVVAIGSGARVAAGESGYYLDILEARLRQLREEQLTVARAGDELVLRLAASSAFEVGRDRLAPAAQQALRRVAAVLTDYRATIIVVLGHTDNSGPAAVNQQLSEQRAMAVVRTLATAGIAPSRLVAVGFGSRRPVAPNTTPEGQETNRRIELRIAVVR